MRLEGIHHVTCITGDAPGTSPSTPRVLGLRMVKKTVNQDDPTVYHLFYADEHGTPGADITFFEYPGARRGRPGEGMIHTIVFRVASAAALDFWERRLGAAGVVTQRTRHGCGSRTRRVSASSSRSPTRPTHRSSRVIPRSRRTCAPGLRRRPRLRLGPAASRELLEGTLGFAPAGESSWDVRGAARGGRTPTTRRPHPARGVPGAGTVHHIAFASHTDEHEAWLGASGPPGATPAASSTASGSARSTSVSRAACCSRLRPSDRASRSTRIPSTSASR